MNRTKLYQELDKIILALIAHQETKYDEDASLKAIHEQLIRLANLKTKQYEDEAGAVQPEAVQQPTGGLSLAQRIMRGQESIKAQGGEI